MKALPRVSLILLLALFSVAPVAASSDSASLRVMSFNIRLSAAQDGENNWNRRSELFFGTVLRYQPDLVGFQEVLVDQYDGLAAHLPGYGFSGGAREDGQRKGEWSLVAYRKDRFSLLDHGDFWLSEQPKVPGSKSWDSAFPRLCSWVLLKETRTGRELIYANTHFDHLGVVARLQSAKIINRELARIAQGRPIIFTGDFNTTEDDPPYAQLLHDKTAGAIRWRDAYREVFPQRGPKEKTFHAFEGGEEGSRIDFVFHTPDFKAVAAGIDRSRSADGQYPSDHYAVTAELRFTEEK